MYGPSPREAGARARRKSRLAPRSFAARSLGVDTLILIWYGRAMDFFLILTLMFDLAAYRGEKDFSFRRELAEGIVTVTDDLTEQRTLTLLAWKESGFRRAVARCEIKGDKGKSHGVFQIQPMTPADKKAACSSSLVEQAGLALRYIHRSAEMCPQNHGPAILNLYVSGRCDRGLAQSKERWGGE